MPHPNQIRMWQVSFSSKRALYLLQKSPISCHIRIRFRCDKCRSLVKEPYISRQRVLYYPKKMQPSISSKRSVFLHTKSPRCPAKEPYIFHTGALYLLAKNPFISSKKSYISAQKPYISLKQRTVSSTVTYIPL